MGPSGDVRNDGTPQPSPSSASSELQSPRSALVSTVVGGAICVYALSLVARLLACGCEDKRWMWGLGAAVLIAVPTSAKQLLELGRAVLAKR